LLVALSTNALALAKQPTTVEGRAAPRGLREGETLNTSS